MTSNEVEKPRVIHVDFKAEKRRKAPTSVPKSNPESAQLIDASIHPIRAWEQFNFRDRMLDISGWGIRILVFVTLVGLGYLVLG